MLTAYGVPCSRKQPITSHPVNFFSILSSPISSYHICLHSIYAIYVTETDTTRCARLSMSISCSQASGLHVCVSVCFYACLRILSCLSNLMHVHGLPDSVLRAIFLHLAQQLIQILYCFIFQKCFWISQEDRYSFLFYFWCWLRLRSRMPRRETV